MSNPPRVFISYSHDSPTHKQWVCKLAYDLRTNGVDTVIDQWDLSPGEDIAVFMESGLKNSERVVVVCSDEYVDKANNGKGGVGYEKMIVTAELIDNLGTKKFIPIIRNSGSPPVPTFLGYRLYIDFEDDDKYITSLETLLREIFNIPPPGKPPVGKNPFGDKGEGSVVISKAEKLSSEPDKESEKPSDEVMHPVDDYKVLIDKVKKLISEPTHPMKLNDEILPLADEARLQIENSEFLNLSAAPDKEGFLIRIKLGDKATDKLARVFAVGCHWANETQSALFSKTLSRMAIVPNPNGTFYDVWVNVAHYPLLRVYYAGALAAFENNSYTVLHSLMIDTMLRNRSHEQEKSLLISLYEKAGFAKEFWKWLPGRERHHIPVSDYLEESLRPFFSEYFRDDESFIATFDRFEFFQSMVYGDLKGEEHSMGFWAPLGSYIWRQRNLFEYFSSEISTKGNKWPPFNAGFFSGSPERAMNVLKNLKEFASRVRGQLGIY